MVASAYEELDTDKRNIENNGYIQIAERLDWIFMFSFLSMLTCPVIYLYLYLWTYQYGLIKFINKFNKF